MWHGSHRITEKSSKIVPLGAPFFRFHALEDQIKALPSVTEAWFFDSKEKWGNPSTTEMLIPVCGPFAWIFLPREDCSALFNERNSRFWPRRRNRAPFFQTMM
jgi:hypothetical protein